MKIAFFKDDFIGVPSLYWCTVNAKNSRERYTVCFLTINVPKGQFYIWNNANNKNWPNIQKNISCVYNRSHCAAQGFP